MFVPNDPFLFICSREILTFVYKKVYSRVFTATLFVLEKMRNNLSVYKQGNRKNVIYAYYDNYTAVKRSELYVTPWIDFQDILPNKSYSIRI